MPRIAGDLADRATQGLRGSNVASTLDDTVSLLSHAVAGGGLTDEGVVVARNGLQEARDGLLEIVGAARAELAAFANL